MRPIERFHQPSLLSRTRTIRSRPAGFWWRRAPHVAGLILGATLVSCHLTRSAPASDVSDLPAPLPIALHNAALPESLSDSAFWTMVTTLSEPGGYFQSENFVSNELGLQHVIDTLRAHTPPGGVYVGVGPEQNFTYLGTLHPRIAFVVDIRRQNLLQQLWYKAVFELSPTRADFLGRLFARPALLQMSASVSADSLMALLSDAPADMLLFSRTFDEVRDHLVATHGFPIDSTDLATLRYVDSIFFVSGPGLNYSSGSNGRSGFGGGIGSAGRGRFSRMPTFAQVASATTQGGVNRGFLGSDSSYRVVRDLQRRNLVVPLVGNFAGPKTVQAVGAWLRERGASVNVFYTSNVEQYLFQQDDNWRRFYQNVATMPLDGDSRFVRSVTNRGFNGPTNFLMTQLTSPILDVVKGVEDGSVRSYYDVISMSRP